jgi:hypothetical protein
MRTCRVRTVKYVLICCKLNEMILKPSYVYLKPSYVYSRTCKIQADS